MLVMNRDYTKIFNMDHVLRMTLLTVKNKKPDGPKEIHIILARFKDGSECVIGVWETKEVGKSVIKGLMDATKKGLNVYTLPPHIDYQYTKVEGVN